MQLVSDTLSTIVELPTTHKKRMSCISNAKSRIQDQE